MAADEKLAVLSAKLPVELKDLFEQLAARRNLTPSALLKRLVEAEIAGRADYEVGDVEAATRSTLEDRGVSLETALAASALNVARRLDRDPSSGPANSAQHQRLMLALAPPTGSDAFDGVSLLRLSVGLRRRGFSLVDESGVLCDVGTLPAPLRAALLDEVAGRAAPGGVAVAPRSLAPQ